MGTLRQKERDRRSGSGGGRGLLTITRDELKNEIKRPQRPEPSRFVVFGVRLLGKSICQQPMVCIILMNDDWPRAQTELICTPCWCLRADVSQSAWVRSQLLNCQACSQALPVFAALHWLGEFLVAKWPAHSYFLPFDSKLVDVKHTYQDKYVPGVSFLCRCWRMHDRGARLWPKCQLHQHSGITQLYVQRRILWWWTTMRLWVQTSVQSSKLC